MKLEDMILASVDDHLSEPADMFDRHLPATLKDRAPRLVTRDDGTQVWVFEELTIPTVGLNSVVGRPKEEYGFEPTSYDQIRKASYDVHARIDDMNVNGIATSICFGSFTQFDGFTFCRVKDRALALRVLQAYNDWHIEDWCGAYPGRFIPLAYIPMWDVDLCVAEIKRVVAKGCHAISFPDNPAAPAKGLPSIHDAYWEPLWQVCNDLNVVINCHIGTGSEPPHASMKSPINAWITAMPISIANAAADWLHLAALGRYPNLKISLSEGGIGWIPYFLERATFTWEHHKAWTGVNFGGKTPTEVFREHFLTCFIDDKFGVKNYQDIGEDNIAYECDYPHSDCTWPNAPEILWENFKGLSDSVINKITHENVYRWFGYDAFSMLDKKEMTVAALRARAQHVDTTPVSSGGKRPDVSQGPVTSGDIMKMFSAA